MGWLAEAAALLPLPLPDFRSCDIRLPRIW
jgi:hypothetical protein